MPPVFTYGTGELRRFWRLNGESLCEKMNIPDIPEGESAEEMRHFIMTEMKDEPFEFVCDVLWWINLYWFGKSDVQLLQDYKWIFNTPEHPFEQFLVGELRVMGTDAYATYATEFPSS